MISERRQIAERFLSEGNGEAARICGNRVRDLNKIQSEAYRQVEEIRGVADAKATEIYAGAYNQSPEAVAFYEFTRTMQSYKSIIAENTTLVLSTGSDLFKFLKGMVPDGDVVPAPTFRRQPMRMRAGGEAPHSSSRRNPGCQWWYKSYVLSSPIRSSGCLNFVGDHHLNVIRSE
jgi:hypothetical protein